MNVKSLVAFNFTLQMREPQETQGNVKHFSRGHLGWAPISIQLSPPLVEDYRDERYCSPDSCGGSRRENTLRSKGTKVQPLRARIKSDAE